MPYLISKYPGSSYRKEYCIAKSISELEQEQHKRFSYINIGLGLFMLYQIQNEGSPVNVIYDGEPFYGQIFIVRVTKSKIIDINLNDSSLIEDRLTNFENY